MSSKQIALYPCSPNTVRGTSTKISASKDKVVYTNGKTVIVRRRPSYAFIMFAYGLSNSRYVTLR